ncbi:hypothetical protein E1166_24105, partial [Micromonospora sp. KC213]
MSDGHTLPDDPAPRQPGRGTLLLGGSLALVLLAAVGATAGWLLAGPAEPSPAGSSQAAPPSASAPPVTEAAPTRSPADRPTT